LSTPPAPTSRFSFPYLRQDE
jgi:hypothetical protein